MKTLQYFFGIIALCLSLSLALEVNAYFFKSTFADDLALVITLVFSTIGFWFFRLKSRLIPVIIGTLLPWLLFVIVSSLIESTNWGSLSLHVFLTLMTFILMTCVGSNWVMSMVASLIIVQFVSLPTLPDQKKYYDRVVSSIQTRGGSGQVVQWKNDRWHYYNGQLQFSTVDRHIWAEAYVQPVMQLVSKEAKVLIIGGESGLIKSELKSFDIELSVLPLDLEFIEKTNRNFGVEILDETVASHLQSASSSYDLIILDLPDPVNVEYDQYYTKEFFELCSSSLKAHGLFISHSSDLYSKNSSRHSILSNVEKARFNVTPYHAQIPTIGHWTWFIGTKDTTDVRHKLRNVKSKTETKWWNQEAMDMMLSFGKSELLSDR